MTADHEDVSAAVTRREELLFRQWNAQQLEQLGIHPLLAHEVAGAVDWHEIADLVGRGCPPELAVEIAR